MTERSPLAMAAAGEAPEVSVSRDMVRRGLWLTPFFVVVSGVIWGLDGALSALFALALVFARDGDQVALAAVIIALASSLLTSYLRAKAESLGLDGTHGLMARAERVVLIAAALLFAPLGALPWGIILLAILSTITVLQRARHVLRQL